MRVVHRILTNHRLLTLANSHLATMYGVPRKCKLRAIL